MTLLNRRQATRTLQALASSTIIAGLSITAVQAQDYRSTQGGYYAHEACKAYESDASPHNVLSHNDVLSNDFIPNF